MNDEDIDWQDLARGVLEEAHKSYLKENKLWAQQALSLAKGDPLAASQLLAKALLDDPKMNMEILAMGLAVTIVFNASESS